MLWELHMALKRLLQHLQISSMKKNILILIISLFTNYAFAQSGESEYKLVKFKKIPKPSAPAHLIISDLFFADAKGSENNALDANETATISFNLENNGLGDAYAIQLSVEDSTNVKGIRFSNDIFIGNLPTGKKTNIIIPISGTTELISSTSNFIIKITEGNKFDADPFSISFKTNEFKKSKLTIDDIAFSNKEQEGGFTTGKVIQLTILLHNKGEGDSKNIAVDFSIPPNVYNSAEDRFIIPELKPNESKILKFDFFANKQYLNPQIPVIIKVSENYGKLVLSETKSVNIEVGTNAIKRLNIEDIKSEKVAISSISLVPDVDKDIPVSKVKNKNRYALIIGNEDYSTFQIDLSKEVNVDFAKNDAKVFKEYCEKTLGIPTENIALYTNATYGTMRQGVDRINKLMKNSDGGLEVIFYYAGHGLPDEETKEAYLIPVDISGSNIQSGIKLQDIYKSFSEYESAGVTMFIDACFSGGARNKQMVNARGVKVIPRSDYIAGNIISFTASSGNQSSNSFMEKKHGIFTYYLLKNLQESKGNISYKDFWENLSKKVSFESIRINNKEQEPQVIIGEKAKEYWQKWKFIE